MSLIHSLAAIAKGGVTGSQCYQRDWSPYLTHFTNRNAMIWTSAIPKGTITPTAIEANLIASDQQSLAVANTILASRNLLVAGGDPTQGIPDFVSFSECTLPGIISHAERFGRFGFVFEKHAIFAAGGRPCILLDDPTYGVVSQYRLVSPSHGPISPQDLLFSLSNNYKPSPAKKLQDFSHEREWRVFKNISFSDCKPIALIIPNMDFANQLVQSTDLPRLLLPLDELFHWGV